MGEQEKTVMSELASGLRGEILKWVVIGLLLGLVSVSALRWGIPVIYGWREEMQKIVREYDDKRQERMKGATSLAEYTLEAVAPAFRRSTERIEKVQNLELGKSGAISPNAAMEWHKISANARLEASKDLGSLSGAPEIDYPTAGELKKNVQDMIQAEITVWESVDDYVTTKAKGQDSDIAFDSLLKNLINYNRFLNSYGPAMQAAERDGLSPVLHSSMRDEDDFHRTMAKHRKKLMLAVGAIVAAFSIVISISLYFFWPLIKTIKPQP